MKTIKTIFILLFSIFLHADEFISIHNNSLLSTLTSGNSPYEFSYRLGIASQAAGDNTSGILYYPQGWSQFKFYLPGGMNGSLAISFSSNTTARIHAKYNLDNNTNTQTLNHQIVSPNISFDMSGTSTTDSMIGTAMTYLVLNSSSANGGWFYITLVGDCGHSVPPAQFCPSSYSANITLTLLKKNEALYSQWLTSTNFLSPGGDPSSNNAWLNIIDVPAQDTVVPRTATLDFGGDPSSYSPPSSSSVAGTSSSSTISSSFSSTASYSSSNSSTTQTCPAGTTWNGWSCVSTVSSSGVTASSVASSTASSCVSGGTILPGPGGTTSNTCVPSTSSSTVSSNSSVTSQSCATGYVKNSFGICVMETSLSSSSSPSSSLDANVTSVPMTINKGWNFIAIPIQTKDTVDLNTTFSSVIGENGYGYKFKFITDANQSYEWIPWSSGTSGTLSPGEGIFLANISGQESTATFKAIEDTNSTKLSSISFIPNKWYIVGFGYDLYLSDIKALYPNSAVWTLDSNGAYKKEENNATIIEKGKGFWFKRYE